MAEDGRGADTDSCYQYWKGKNSLCVCVSMMQCKSWRFDMYNAGPPKKRGELDYILKIIVSSEDEV